MKLLALILGALVLLPGSRVSAQAPDSLSGTALSYQQSNGKKGVLTFAVSTYVQTGSDAGDGTYAYLKVDASHGQFTIQYAHPAGRAGNFSVVDLSFQDSRSGSFVSNYHDAGNDTGTVTGTFTLVHTAGPSGQFTQTVAGLTNAVWDLTTVAALTNQNFEILKGGQRQVSVAYLADFQQKGSGVLSGSDQTTVTLGYEGHSSWVNVSPFSALYKINGTINSSGGKARGNITATVAGKALMEGATRQVTAKHQTTFTLDNIHKRITITRKHSASASGFGSVSDSQVYGPTSFGQLIPQDGGWTLNLTLGGDGKKIAGAATVTLETGTLYTYKVTGTYNSGNGQSKLVLTGSDLLTKGSSLQVTLTGDVISLIKGRIAGQAVLFAQ